MPNPTGSDLYVAAPLNSISVNYFQDQVEFMADKVFPRVPVQIQGGLYWVMDRAAWNRADAKPRAPGTQTAGGGWTQHTANYFCTDYGFHKDNSDPDYANSQNPFPLDAAATTYVSRQIALAREQVFVANFFAPSIWTGIMTGTASTASSTQFVQWDKANSTPIEDISAQVLAMQQLTGFKPNKLVLGPQVYQGLRNNAEVIARIAVTQTRIATTALLASLFDVDEVFVPHVITDTANEGATDAFSFSYGKSALLVYAPPAPAINEPSAGYIFTWTGLLGDQAFGARMKRYRMEEIASWRIEGEAAFDMRVVAPDLGTFFATAVS